MCNPFDLSTDYLAAIRNSVDEQKRLGSRKAKELFGVLDKAQNEEERVALEFLFAYMSINDMADYDGTLFLNHVRSALKSRELSPWGSKIPGATFLHFVLPYRINNENIEEYRDVFFDTLFASVKGLSMYDAILEVNHWCHEKATYTSTDSRTVSPLTMLRTAKGRCGEESTFLVAVLRSLSIPARECYTPLWAHSDDNHAWVEAWADGRWYFLGACEPEARLNRGWFSDPTRRAMLITSRVLGNYPGPEEITLSHRFYTEVNLLNNYTATKRITIRVVDANGIPAQDAKVNFNVFNYGGFGPLARLKTDQNGEATISTGLGDLMVYASTDSAWGATKVDVRETAFCKITLTAEPPENTTFELEMVPPAEGKGDVEPVTPEQQAENERRNREEDRIRGEYEASFICEAESNGLSESLGLPADRVWQVIKKARGSCREIAAYLQEQTPVFGKIALGLLESLAPKDLVDTTVTALVDHLSGSAQYSTSHDTETFRRYILCPRVGIEMIAPFRRLFTENFGDEERRLFVEDPELLVNWVARNIEAVEDRVHYRGAATPAGSFCLGKADPVSRNILFVALARTFGIPARLAPEDRRPQYMLHEKWNDAVLNEKQPIGVAKAVDAGSGVIQLRRSDGCTNDTEYYRNFTIARFTNNAFTTLHFGHLKREEIDKPLEVAPGHYRLTTGNRLSDGSVLIRVSYFTVGKGTTTEVPLVIRQNNNTTAALGQVDRTIPISMHDGSHAKLDELMYSYLVLAWIEPDKEPTKHLIRELIDVSRDLSAANARLCIITDTSSMSHSWSHDLFNGLPQSTVYSMDSDYTTFSRVTASCEAGIEKKLPVVFVLDPSFVIRFTSSGYRIGTGSEILKIVKGEH